MAGEPVLVVDDNPIDLRLATVVLKLEGYDVRAAADAEAALAVLELCRPRVILLDLQLPGLGGLALTQRLKADPTTRDIPILAMTAHAMKGDEEKARQAGCDGYIPKPIDTRGLPRLLARYLRAPRRGTAASGRSTGAVTPPRPAR